MDGRQDEKTPKTYEKHIRDYVRLALAIAIIRTKPPTCGSILEYTRQLQYAVTVKSVKWHRQKNIFHQEMDKIKAGLIQHDTSSSSPDMFKTSDSDAVNSVLSLTAASKSSCQLLPTKCDSDSYERVLDSCLFLKYNCHHPFVPSGECTTERMQNTLHILFSALKGSATSLPQGSTTVTDFPKSDALDEVVLRTLVHLDVSKVLPSLVTQLDIPLQSFFRAWMTQFIMETNSFLSLTTVTAKTRKRVIWLLCQLANGPFLRRSIIQAAIDILSDAVEKLVDERKCQVRGALPVSTLENMSIVILLLEQLQENHISCDDDKTRNPGRQSLDYTSISSSWQRLLGVCFCRLYDRFPLVVNRVLRLHQLTNL